MRPLLLPSVSATEAQSLTLLAQRARDLPLWPLPPEVAAGAGPVGRLHLLPARREAPVLGEGELLAIRGTWAGAQFVLAVPPQGGAVLAQVLGGAMPLHALPAPWLQAFDALVARWLGAQVSGLGRGAAQVLAVQRLSGLSELPQLAHEFHWQADFGFQTSPEVAGGDGASLLGLLRVDSLGLMLMAGLSSQSPPAQPAAALSAGLPCRLRLRVGETTLPLARWRALRPGQALLLQTRYLGEDRTLHLAVGEGALAGWGFLARLGDHELTVLRGPMKTTTAPPEETGGFDDLAQGPGASGIAGDGDADWPQAPGEPLPLDQMPVRLTFDLGEATLTLEELQRLQPGQVIPTDRIAQDYVAVRANGALVGRGVLMELDGRLAVSLTALAPAASR